MFFLFFIGIGLFALLFIFIMHLIYLNFQARWRSSTEAEKSNTIILVTLPVLGTACISVFILIMGYKDNQNRIEREARQPELDAQYEKNRAASYLREKEEYELKDRDRTREIEKTKKDEEDRIKLREIQESMAIVKKAEMARLKQEQEDKNKLIELERLKQEEIAKLKRVTDLGNGIKIDLSLIPSGYAKKGPDDSFGLNTSSLSIEKPFYISKYETTQEQWEIIMGNNPCRTKNPKLPVTNVSWLDCQAFIKKLNLKTDGDYRLPTEDEWEYACRAGTTTSYSFGESISKENANYDGSSIKTVGNYKPNAFGLYDMHGNVLEWCEDWYAEKSGSFSNSNGPEPKTVRVLRGGSFDYSPAFAKSSGRSYYSPTSRSNLVGFRLVRTK
jgi:Sulfatase-modifying factor enzyme 1